MKKTDIAMIILVCSISVLVSFFVMSSFLGAPNKDKAEVRTFQPIDSEVSQPNKKIFNDNSINPTYEVYVQGKAAEMKSAETKPENQNSTDNSIVQIDKQDESN